MLCCSKNHRCESSRVTSPLPHSCSPPNIKLFCGILQVEDVVRQLNKRSELLHVVSEMCVNLLLLLLLLLCFFPKKPERTLLTKSIVRRRLDWIVSRANTFHIKNQKKTSSISSTDSKGRITLCGIINYTTGKYCSVIFIWMVALYDFIHRLKSKNHLVLPYLQYHRKAFAQYISFKCWHLEF